MKTSGEKMLLFHNQRQLEEMAIKLFFAEEWFQDRVVENELTSVAN